jgi:hypothetical protein
LDHGVVKALSCILTVAQAFLPAAPTFLSAQTGAGGFACQCGFTADDADAIIAKRPSLWMTF